MLFRSANDELNRKQRFGELEVELVGVCTDVCVISNALILRTYLPNVEITVDANCCAGTTAEAHNSALMIMENSHIKIIK